MCAWSCRLLQVKQVARAALEQAIVKEDGMAMEHPPLRGDTPSFRASELPSVSLAANRFIL